MVDQQAPVLHVPARDIPIPSTLSAQAQMVLGLPRQEEMTWPPLEDTEAVAAHIAALNPPDAAANGPLVASCYGSASTGVACETDHIDVDGVSVYTAVPEGLDADDPRIYLVIHGAWISGGGEMARAGAAMTAGALGVRTWAVDYRMPPTHLFPAAQDDCFTVYTHLVENHRPEHIIIGGMSAGANMTMSTLLRARDAGLPMPAAAVVNTPPIDLTQQGDTLHTNTVIDPAMTGEGLDAIIRVCAPGQDLTDPLLSPIFGEYTDAFPPVFLSAGTRDFLLSDTVRLHRRLRQAGVAAELHVWEGAPHYMFLGMAPEDLERAAEQRRFMEANWEVKG